MKPAIVLLWLCMTVSLTAAQETPETRVALIIGNGAYANVGQLDNPKRDASAVAEGLRLVGFQTVQVESDLGHDAMLKALRRFEEAADKADWALVYYAGHGIEVGGVNYLIPIDARIRSDRDVDEEAISLAQVQKRLEGARKLRLVILDACRDNPFLTTMKRTLAIRSVSRGLGPVEPDVGTLVAFSAKAGQTALDGVTGATNSPYATAIIKNLAIPNLELDFFFRLVRADVLKATGRNQDPATYGQLPAERFVFRPGNEPMQAIIPNQPQLNILPPVAPLQVKPNANDGWIGVRIQNVDDMIAESVGMAGGARGALIANLDDGPAKAGGLKVGDIILKINDNAVNILSDVKRILTTINPGELVEITVHRNKIEQILTVVVGSAPQNEKGTTEKTYPSNLATRSERSRDTQKIKDKNSPFGGLTIVNTSSSVADELKMRFPDNEVVVLSCEKKLPCAQNGLKRGDVILEINNEKISSTNEFIDATKKFDEGFSFVKVKTRSGKKISDSEMLNLTFK